MAEETPLTDGWPSVAGSVLVDGRVHRNAGPWTPAVHALLDHLARVGFDGAPQVVGFDGLGREVLTWVEGDAPSAPWPEWMAGEEVLAGLGLLLRRYHDAAAGFLPPEGAVWRSWLGSKGGPVIRHGDLWPSNVVFRRGRPAAFIDWEFAQPGTAIEDLASAAKHWVPLISDERAVSEGWPPPIDRRARLAILCDAYGLSRSERLGLIPAVVANLSSGLLSHRTWAEAGVPGFVEMWAAGSGTVIDHDRSWIERNRASFAGFDR